MDTKLLIAVFLVMFVAYTSAAGSCPLASKVSSCSPKCTENYECTNGRVCCANSCNAKSCSEPSAYGGSSSNDKNSQSGGPGAYCNNVKCKSFESCKLDPATKRMKSGGPGAYCNNVKCKSFESCKLDPATKRMKCMRT